MEKYQSIGEHEAFAYQLNAENAVFIHEVDEELNDRAHPRRKYQAAKDLSVRDTRFT